jgi:hypothetical protein
MVFETLSRQVPNDSKFGLGMNQVIIALSVKPRNNARMGIFEKLKSAKSTHEIKKANEAARAQYESALANWEVSQTVAQRLLSALNAAAIGQDAVENTAVLKKGEVALWTGLVSFHESRRQPGTYVGSSQGVSIPLGHGFRYRVGAMKGTYIPGDDVQTPLDRGSLLLTSMRLIFNGRIKTQEWAFAKWTGADTSENEMEYLFHVSNRQKASGVSFSDFIAGQEFNHFLGVAMRIEKDGIANLIKALEEGISDSQKNKPVEPKEITA